MGLIARAIEEAGIPTLSMSSARDITRSAWPARSVYLDYPLGHTAGRPNDPELNASIMRDTLTAFEALTEPGAMSHLSYRWSDNDDWKDKVFAPVDTADSSEQSSEYEDDRVARHDTHLNIRPRLMRPQPNTATTAKNAWFVPVLTTND